MARILGLLSVAYFVFFLYVLLDVVLSEQADVRNLPKLLWVLVVLVVPLAGGIAWLVAGRPERGTIAPGGAGPPGRRPDRNAPTRGRRARPPLGPDDDPDFLRRIDEQLRDHGDEDSDA